MFLFRARHRDMAEFFEKEDTMTFCSDFNGLLKELGCDHDPAYWRFFIDSRKICLKAGLLHSGNVKPSVPLVQAFSMAETLRLCDSCLIPSCKMTATGTSVET